MNSLCVDLDGTLVQTDILYEAMLLYVKPNPLRVFLLFFWLLKGSAYLKQQLALRVTLSPSTLPYNQELLTWLRQEKVKGRKLVLVTAADQLFARNIAEHLQLFDEVLASNGAINLKKENKANLLNARYGAKNYDYVGNEKDDLAIWKFANQAFVVSKSSRLIRKIQKFSPVGHHFHVSNISFKDFLKAIRIHQYAKNVLLFVPLLTSYLFFQIPLLLTTLLGFFAFCCVASSVYLLNDLFDIEADRCHERKSKRAIASGLLTIPQAITFIMVFSLSAIGICCFLPADFIGVLLLYFTISMSYSLFLKKHLLIDVIVLSILYTIRVAAGMALLPVNTYSIWLLLFSIFIFLSLAFLKRVSELVLLKDKDSLHGVGRAYQLKHYPLLLNFGITNGFLAILVFALYLNSLRAISLYHHPQLLLMVFPVLIYWLCRLWLLAADGKIMDDPVLFTVKDKISYVSAFVILIIMFVAKY